MKNPIPFSVILKQLYNAGIQLQGTKKLVFSKKELL